MFHPGCALSLKLVRHRCHSFPEWYLERYWLPWHPCGSYFPLVWQWIKIICFNFFPIFKFPVWFPVNSSYAPTVLEVERSCPALLYGFESYLEVERVVTSVSKESKMSGGHAMTLFMCSTFPYDSGRFLTTKTGTSWGRHCFYGVTLCSTQKTMALLECSVIAWNTQRLELINEAASEN